MRIGREQRVPDSIACTENPVSRVGVGCGAAHALPVQPTAPFPHADHLNSLLLRVAGTSTRAFARAFASEPQPFKNTGQKLLNNNTAFKSKKTHSLTLLLQNHPDHFNNLLLDLWCRNIHDLLNLCTSGRWERDRRLASLSQLGGDENALWLTTNESPDCTLDDMEFRINAKMRLDLPGLCQHQRRQKADGTAWARCLAHLDEHGQHAQTWLHWR